MDRSLWLLLVLRVRAWARRRGRGVRTPRGALLAVVGALVFLPMFASFFLAPRFMVGAQLDAIRRYGPLALLGYCVLNVLLSSGDRAVDYSPAEVNFLFSGPYRARQLLIYKVVGGVAASLVTALLMAFALGHHAATFAAAYAGLFLTVELIYLFSLAVGLAVSTCGTLAFSRARRLLLACAGLALAAALWPVGRAALGLPFWEVVNRAMRSPSVGVVLAPFRPFVNAFTAERVWPDLLKWSGLALLVDLVLLGLVLGLNAGFLEASAAASARAHERLRRVRRGSPWGGGAVAHFRTPMLPWWGGIGPNLSRQLTAASRSPAQFVGLAVLFAMPVVLFVLQGESGRDQGALTVLPFLLVIVLFAQSSVGYDFRADHRRMETLKTLPIRPDLLALGQLLTPVAVLSLAGFLPLAAIARLHPQRAPLLAASAVLIVPVNFLLVAVENLYFLWYPYRSTGVNSFDLQAIGRQIVLMTAKAAVVTVVGAVAAGLGTLVFLFGGGGWALAVASAAAVVSLSGVVLVPIVALAFERFDVAGEPRE